MYVKKVFRNWIKIAFGEHIAWHHAYQVAHFTRQWQGGVVIALLGAYKGLKFPDLRHTHLVVSSFSFPIPALNTYLFRCKPFTRVVDRISNSIFISLMEIMCSLYQYLRVRTNSGTHWGYDLGLYYLVQVCFVFY